MSGQIQNNNINAVVDEVGGELLRELLLPQSRPSNPIILMLGGLQGSGKTTLLDNVKSEYGLVIISGDIIRQRLFDNGYEFSEQFPKVVEQVVANILKHVLDLGYSIAIDIHSDRKRLDEVRKALSNYNKYRLITIYLKTDGVELIKRVQKRKSIAGIYQGKLNELEAAIKTHRKIDESMYDYVIDTVENNPSRISMLVKDKIDNII